MNFHAKSQVSNSKHGKVMFQVKISKTGDNTKIVFFFTKHDLVAYQINQHEETNPKGVVIVF